MSRVTSNTSALVLGGGGPVGRAWQTGLIAGFNGSGIDFSTADLIVGTSAGAIVGAETALGLDMSRALPVFVPSVAPASRPSSAIQQVMAAIARVAASPAPELELKKIGQFAIAAETPSEEIALSRSNLAGVSARPWPSNFQATSINTRTGLRQVWSASSGVSLEKALAASSAFPGVWPPITIGADRYMDGGVSSMLNADLAMGHGRVVVVSCFSLESHSTAAADRMLLGEIEILVYGGSTIEVVSPDDRFLALTNNGAMMLNPALEPDAFQLGRQQAHDEVERVLRLWGA